VGSIRSIVTTAKAVLDKAARQLHLTPTSSLRGGAADEAIHPQPALDRFVFGSR